MVYLYPQLYLLSKILVRYYYMDYIKVKIKEKFRLGSFIGINYPYTFRTRDDAYRSLNILPSHSDPNTYREKTKRATISNKFDIILNDDDGRTTNGILLIGASEQEYVNWIRNPKQNNKIVGHRYEYLADNSLKWVDIIALCHNIRYMQIVKFSKNKFTLRKAEQYADIEAIKLYFTTPFTFHKFRPLPIILGLGLITKVSLGYTIHKISCGYLSGFSSLNTYYNRKNIYDINYEYIIHDLEANLIYNLNNIISNYNQDLNIKKSIFEKNINKTTNKINNLKL